MNTKFLAMAEFVGVDALVCPFCGSDEFIWVILAGGKLAVGCDPCGARGSVCDSANEALEWWNLRASMKDTLKDLRDKNSELEKRVDILRRERKALLDIFSLNDLFLINEGGEGCLCRLSTGEPIVVDKSEIDPGQEGVER